MYQFSFLVDSKVRFGWLYPMNCYICRNIYLESSHKKPFHVSCKCVTGTQIYLPWTTGYCSWTTETATSRLLKKSISHDHCTLHSANLSPVFEKTRECPTGEAFIGYIVIIQFSICAEMRIAEIMLLMLVLNQLLWPWLNQVLKH